MKKSFLIYQDWEEVFDSLTDAQVGKLLKAMLDHARGEEVNLPSRLSLLFISFRQQLDRNSENYKKKSEAYRENANKRWQKEKSGTKLSNGMQSHAMAYDKDKVKDKDIYKTENNFSSYKKTEPNKTAGLSEKEFNDKLWNIAEVLSEKGAKKNV